MAERERMRTILTSERGRVGERHIEAESMIKLRVFRDFTAFPVWASWLSEGRRGLPGLPSFVEEDEVLRKLADELVDMNVSYYEFDSHDMACWFNEEQQRADKEILLSLVARIVDRLNELNDGSYVVEDCESEELREL